MNSVPSIVGIISASLGFLGLLLKWVLDNSKERVRKEQDAERDRVYRSKIELLENEQRYLREEVREIKQDLKARMERVFIALTKRDTHDNL